MTLRAIAIFAFLAFAFCYAATPVIRDFFIMRELLDHPDEDRKRHRKPVPRSGGIGIVLSYFAALGVVYALLPSGAVLYVQHQALFQAVLPATSLMFLIGLADDLFNMRPRHKLAGQFVAALFAVGLGARLTFHTGPWWLGFVFSVVWLLACTNAVNLIDGMDGLATGVGLTATLTTLVVALLTGNVGLAIATAPLAGALLAFLRYNFAPATVFLGDSGSLTIGFLLGCLGLVWSGHLGGWGMLGPMFALALPLMDTCVSISRRFLRRVPIFEGDFGHIHHRVQALGLSTRDAALVLYACCLLFAALAVLQTRLGRWSVSLFAALFVAMVIAGVHHLDYVEFLALRRMLSQRVLRRCVREEIYLEDLRRALVKATSPEECWSAVRHACTALHIANVQLCIGGKRFAVHEMAAAPESKCTLHVPLTEDGWIVLIGRIDIAPRAIASAMEPLHSFKMPSPVNRPAPVSLANAA